MIEQLLQQILQAITNLNPTNASMSSFGGGRTVGGILAAEKIADARSKQARELTKKVMDDVSTTMYANGLRLMGYKEDAIDKKIKENTTDVQIGIATARRFAEKYAGEGMNAFTGAVISQKNAYGNRGPEYLQSYQSAARDIAAAVGQSGSIASSYTLNDAFKLASKSIVEGKYDFMNPEKRGMAIVADLEAMAEGVNNLTDALGAGMTEVLDAFENLTGTSSTLMGGSRFTNTANRLAAAVEFKNATMQDIQQATHASQQYLASTGASRALMANLGIHNATVMAQGISVDGASTAGVEKALNRSHSMALNSGQARELSAAFTDWLNVNGLEANDATYNEFVRAIGGDAATGYVAPEAVQKYLTDNNIDSSWVVTSGAVTKNMEVVTPRISSANMMKQYERGMKSLAEQSGGLLSEADLFIGDDELKQKLTSDFLIKKQMEKEAKARGIDLNTATDEQIERFYAEAAKKVNSGEFALTHLSAAELRELNQTTDKIVYQRGVLAQQVTGAESAADGLQVLKNINQAESKNRSAANLTNMFRELGNMKSTKGMAGIFEAFTKEHGVKSVKDVLQAYAGITLSTEQEDLLNQIEKDTHLIDTLSSISKEKRTPQQQQQLDEATARLTKNKTTFEGTLTDEHMGRLRTGAKHFRDLGSFDDGTYKGTLDRVLNSELADKSGWSYTGTVGEHAQKVLKTLDDRVAGGELSAEAKKNTWDSIENLQKAGSISNAEAVNMHNRLLYGKMDVSKNTGISAASGLMLEALNKGMDYEKAAEHAEAVATMLNTSRDDAGATEIYKKGRNSLVEFYKNQGFSSDEANAKADRDIQNWEMEQRGGRTEVNFLDDILATVKKIANKVLND